jgi:hypothetical protein
MILPQMWDCPLEENARAFGFVLLHVSLAAGDPPAQKNPLSIWHLLLHPSPSTVLPSSHGKTNLLPSPQT